MNSISHAIAPSAPPIIIKAVPSSARTITIAWKRLPLRDRNGIITNYNITYYSSQWMHGNTIQADGAAISSIIDQLIPFTTYNITITAATIAGLGPASSSAFATTLQSGR